MTQPALPPSSMACAGWPRRHLSYSRCTRVLGHGWPLGAPFSAWKRTGVRCLDPAGYLDFLSLQAGAGTIVTDSGGVQEEASALGVPCYTLRANTERPITISRGTNVLLGDDPESLDEVTVSHRPPTPCVIPLWDGHAGDRAADAILTEFPEIVESATAALA